MLAVPCGSEGASCLVMWPIGRGPCSGNSPDEPGDSPFTRVLLVYLPPWPASTGICVFVLNIQGLGPKDPREPGKGA